MGLRMDSGDTICPTTENGIQWQEHKKIPQGNKFLMFVRHHNSCLNSKNYLEICVYTPHPLKVLESLDHLYHRIFDSVGQQHGPGLLSVR